MSGPPWQLWTVGSQESQTFPYIFFFSLLVTMAAAAAPHRYTCPIMLTLRLTPSFSSRSQPSRYEISSPAVARKNAFRSVLLYGNGAAERLTCALSHTKLASMSYFRREEQIKEDPFRHRWTPDEKNTSINMGSTSLHGRDDPISKRPKCNLDFVPGEQKKVTGLCSGEFLAPAHWKFAHSGQECASQVPLIGRLG